MATTPDLVTLRHTLEWSRDFVSSDEARKPLQLVEQELHQRARPLNRPPQNSRPMRPV